MPLDQSTINQLIAKYGPSYGGVTFSDLPVSNPTPSAPTPPAQPVSTPSYSSPSTSTRNIGTYGGSSGMDRWTGTSWVSESTYRNMVDSGAFNKPTAPPEGYVGGSYNPTTGETTGGHPVLDTLSQDISPQHIAEMNAAPSPVPAAVVDLGKVGGLTITQIGLKPSDINTSNLQAPAGTIWDKSIGAYIPENTTPTQKFLLENALNIANQDPLKVIADSLFMSPTLAPFIPFKDMLVSRLQNKPFESYSDKLFSDLPTSKPFTGITPEDYSIKMDSYNQNLTAYNVEAARLSGIGISVEDKVGKLTSKYSTIQTDINNYKVDLNKYEAAGSMDKIEYNRLLGIEAKINKATSEYDTEVKGLNITALEGDYNKLNTTYTALTAEQTMLNSLNVANKPTIVDDIFKTYDNANVMLRRQLYDPLNTISMLQKMPEINLKEFGDTSQMPIYSDALNFAKGIATNVIANPIDLPLFYGLGAGFKYAEGVGGLTVAKASMRTIPIISKIPVIGTAVEYAGRTASTPLAEDIFKTLKIGAGGYIVATGVNDIIQAPTYSEKGSMSAQLVKEFGMFGKGYSAVGMPEPVNTYASKTLFGQVEKAGPLTNIWEKGVVKLSQLELYARGQPESARALGEAAELTRGLRYNKPYNPNAEMNLWDNTEVTFEHKQVLDKLFADNPHSLYGSGVQVNQGVPLELMPKGSLGNVPGTDVDAFTNVKASMDYLSKIPGAVTKYSKTDPAAITDVYYGGVRFSTDLHNIPLEFPRLPGEVLPRIGGGKYTPEWKDLIAFKILGDPFYAAPKPYDLTLKGNKDYLGNLNYEQNQMQTVRMMDAFRKNLPTATSTDPAIARGGRMEKDTVHMLSRFEDALQAEKLRGGLTKGRAKEIVKLESTLKSLKGREILYRPGVTEPLQTIKLGDTQLIAGENLEYGLTYKGDKMPAKFSPSQSLKDIPYALKTTKMQTESYLSRTGEVAGKSRQLKSLADYPDTRAPQAERIKNILRKGEPVYTKTIHLKSSPPKINSPMYSLPTMLMSSYGLPKAISAKSYKPSGSSPISYKLPSINISPKSVRSPTSNPFKSSTPVKSPSPTSNLFRSPTPVKSPSPLPDPFKSPGPNTSPFKSPGSIKYPIISPDPFKSPRPSPFNKPSPIIYSPDRSPTPLRVSPPTFVSPPPFGGSLEGAGGGSLNKMFKKSRFTESMKVGSGLGKGILKKLRLF